MLDKILNTKFKTESQDDFEEYLVAQKLNIVLRKIAKTLAVSETLTQDGDTFTYLFESTFKNHKMVFKLGEPFLDRGLDGRHMKTTFFLQGDTLIATQENTKEGDVPCRLERRLRNDGKLEVKFISVPTNTVCVKVMVPVAKK